MTIPVDKVRGLIDKLAQQRQVRAAIMTEVESAERSAQSAAAEVSQISQRIDEREAALAQSGGALPASLFEEDRQLALAQRNSRILALRASAQRDRLKPIDQEIGRLKGEITIAWKQAGETAYRDTLARFEATAMELRTEVIEMMVLAATFRDVPISVPEVIVQQPGQRSEIINNVDLGWLRQTDSERAELHATLSALRKEIDQKA